MNWHEVDELGQIICSGVCPDDIDVSSFGSRSVVFCEDDLISFKSHRYIKSENKFVPLPERPHNHSYFDYENICWVADYDSALANAKATRNQKLQETDWVELPSARERLGEEMYQKWMEYRQALRDVTKQPDPLNIVWAEKPVKEN